MELSDDTYRSGQDSGSINGLGRRFDFVVIACVLILAILLGVLNNLRVADERQVKWFEAPPALANQEAVVEMAP